jgi:hypothetical protein
MSSTVVAGLQGVALILSALAMGAGQRPFCNRSCFRVIPWRATVRFERLFTYAFIHTPPYWVFLSSFIFSLLSGVRSRRTSVAQLSLSFT